MRKIILFLFLSVSSLFSQDPNWNSVLIFPPYPSPYFSDWERNPDIGSLTINYIGTAPVEFYFEVVINIDGYGDAIIGRTAKREYLSGPVSEILTFSDLSDWESTKVNSDLQNVVLQTGTLPEANYSVCVKTYALNGDLLTDACTDFEIALPNPPQLLSPEDEGSIKIAQPTFMWNAVSTPAAIEVFYQIKIVDMLENQSPFRAIESNIPVLEKEIPNANLYVYQLDDYPLDQNHTYAWQVQATMKTEKNELVPVATNNGYSEIWQFTFGSPAGELGIDTLVLIEDFAYLIDLTQLDIKDNNTFITLDGSCRLLLKGVGNINKYVDVFTQNLMIQKDTYDNPIFLGGNILGTIGEKVFGKEIVGDFFKPTELEFIPPSQFNIGGNFYLGDNVDVPLTGKLSYENGQLVGNLIITGTQAAPVFSLGDDLFKMNITSLSIAYPTIETNVQGDLSLFGSASNCNVSAINIDKSGNYSANISCNLGQEIPLLKGSTMFNLKVDKVNGSISGNLLSNSVKYDVLVNGGMQFKMDSQNEVGADVSFRLKPNDFKLVSFVPSANLKTVALDLGWLKWKFDNLKLNKLAFQNNNWDFDLAMDIDLSFPDFGNKTLPTIPNISFTPTGFVFPKIDFDNFSIPNIDFAGFSLDLYKFSTPGFTFDLSKWNPSSIAKMAFDWKVKFNMPNLPIGTDDSFKLPNWDLGAKIVDGNFKLKFPDMKFPSGVKVPIPGNLNFDIKSLAGELNTNFNGSLMSFIPDVKIGGTVTLPEALRCDGEDGKITLSGIKLNGDGTFSGVIEDFVPKCPINIGLASLYMKKSKIEFKKDAGQKILLSGSAGIKFTKGGAGKEVGNLNVVYEIINNRLVKVDGKIEEEFKWDLPVENPMFSFNVTEATLANGNLTIDSRSQLNLPGSDEKIGVTFDKFKIDLNDYSIKDGRIIFDQPFAMLIDGIENGGINFSTIKKGEIPKKKNFIYLELPSSIKIDKDGFALVGESKAVINFSGKQLDRLSAKFSNDFAFSLIPFKVTKGKCEIFFEKDKVAYLNRDGFFPDPNYFLNKVLPEQLPLPTLKIAYLQLKQNNKLLVNVSTEGNSTRISTKNGQPIELVFPILKLKPNEETPKILVNFSIAIDDVTGKVTDGFIKGTVPAQSAAAFDLSKVGIPYAINSIYYGNVEGVSQFKLTGKVKAFETELGCDSLILNITQAGVLKGRADCNFAKTIHLMPNSDNLNLVVNKVSGDFNVDLKSANYNFDLQLDSDLRFAMSPTESFGIWTKLGLSKSGVRLINSKIDSLKIPKIDLSQFKLGLENLRLGKLSYSKTPNADGITGWDFEFGMDLDFDFPGLNFKIPKIPNVTLNRSGFHTMSEISIPSFADSLKFQFNGIELKPLAFRMPKLDFNWFNPGGSVSNWGFKFDFEINFPNLANATGAMKNPKLTILNAGFSNGVITGNIAPVTFNANDNLNLNFGNSLGFSIRTISGGLFNDNGAQGIGFKFKGDFKLPDFMQCAGQSSSVSMGNAEFSLNSLGQVSGSVQNFVPTCPINLGFGKFNVTSSSLNFAIAQAKQSAILDMTGNLVVNTGNNSTVTANGALKLDLLTGEVIDGEIGINQQFVWGIPSDKPVLNFTINRAILNKDGLKINGASSLQVPNSQPIAATFNNLVFDYRKLKVKSGSLDITGGFALKLAIKDGGIDWSVIPPNEALTEDKTAKIGFTSSITLDSTGISVSGDAIASVRWDNDPAHQFGDIKITYSNDFNFSLSPFKVSKGHADLIYNNNVIASLTHDGFTLGNIFGLIPMPEVIPLPSIDIAYLRIKSGNQLLVQSETVANGLRIYTTQANPVSLLLPALKYGNTAVDSIPTIFDVVINPSSGEVISGEIILAKTDSSSLINLKARGIPVDIYKIRYGKVNGNYALTANANISIPSILNGLPLKLRKLSFSSSGISGSINVGEFSETYKTNIATVAKTTIGSEASITLEGLEVAFGAQSKFRFSGKLIPKMLVNGNDTTKIQYASSWNVTDKKFTFSFDFKTGQQFDFGIGSFKPLSVNTNPAMKLSLMEDDFELLMNGEFKAASFGDDFALTIEGLKITKNSVSAEAISRPRNNPLQFDLFNSKFKIFDPTPQDKAIKFTYNNGVLKLVLSGELEIFDHKTSFTDFTIGTDGTLSIGSANFIDGSDLTIIQNYLALNNLGIVSEVNNSKTEYKLSVGGWIKLPEPVGKGDTKFNFGFNIAPNGTITANQKINNQIIFINEQQGIGNGDQSEYDLWKAKFDLTYLALNLNFNDMEESSVQMVADIYWDNNLNKRLSIGDKSNLNNIKPGLEIDFAGDVKWKNASVHGDIEFKSDMLKIGISNIQLSSDTENLTIGINGHLGLNASAISGELSLENFKFNKTGIVNAGRITEGSLSINNVVTIKLKQIIYKNTPSQIWVKKSESGEGADSTQISVNSYLSFGGEITITGLGSGGVDKFLTYSTDNSFTLLIKNAHFEVAGVMKASMDLSYYSGANGFKILAGGMANLTGGIGIKATIMGKIAKIDNKLSFGFFIAATGIRIDITPVTITGIGGGFFYNPTKSDIDKVKELAQVGIKAKEKVAVKGGKFAIFLFGEAVIAEKTLIKGRVLITITDSQFMLDGRVILLDQQKKIEGAMHLLIQWSPQFAAEGVIEVEVTVPYIIKGKGNMGFYVFSKAEWAIYGKTEMKVFNYLNTSSDFFVGNSGFMIGMSSSFNFDIWIIEVGAGIEVKVWYLVNKSWGAYAEAYVRAEILWGVVKAKGWLKCALIGTSNHTFLYGQAGLEIHTFIKDWSGSVWAKIDNGHLSGGTGSDSDMDALIADAAGQSQQAQQEMDDMKKSVQDRANTGAQFSKNELKAAFAKLTEYGTKYKYGSSAEKQDAINFFEDLIKVEEFDYSFNFAFITNISLSYTPSNVEKNIYKWVIDNIYKAPGAPNLTQYNTSSQSIQTAMQEYNTKKNNFLPSFNNALATISPVTNTLNQSISDPTANAQFSSSYTKDSNGNYIIRTKPSMNIDEELAIANKNNMNNGINSIQQYKEKVYAEYQKINGNINKLEKVLRGGVHNTGAEEFSFSYATLLQKIHSTYFYEYLYYKEVNSWSRKMGRTLSDRNLSSNPNRTSKIMKDKATRIYDNAIITDIGFSMLKALNMKRVEEIAKLSGLNAANITQKINDERNWWDYNKGKKSKIIARSVSKGKELWETIPRLGLKALKDSSRNTANKKLNEKNRNLEQMGHIQAEFTGKMNLMYSSLTSLSESKYDILTKLVKWESELPLSLKNNSSKRKSRKDIFATQKSVLEAKMTVPIISRLRVTNIDIGIAAYSLVAWNISGPRSDKITFMINYDSRNPDITAQGFQSIGNKSNMQLFYTPRIGQTVFGNTNFTLMARNEVGYTIHKKITFKPTFKNTSNISWGSVTTTEAPKDITPPIITQVSYPYQKHLFQLNENSSGSDNYYMVNYLGDSTRISAKWTAHDGESGIQEYRYNLIKTKLPTPTGGIQYPSPNNLNVNFNPNSQYNNVVIGSEYYSSWTNNFGRDNVVINGKDFNDGDVYQIRVAARNGDNLWTDNTKTTGSYSFYAGKNIFVQVDLTPPPAPVKSFLMPLFAPMSIAGPYVLREKVTLPFGAENSESQVSLGYSSLANSVSVQQGVYSRMASFDPTAILGIASQMSSSASNVSSSMSYMRVLQMFDNSKASVSVNYTVSTDPITSQGFPTEVRISSVHNDTVSTNWFRNYSNTFDNNLSVINNILSYIDSFYVDIRCVDLAKNRSKITRFVVQPHDKTPPTKPLVNFAYSSNYHRAYLVFDTQSFDAECGIKYYEVGLGTNSKDITFDDSIKILPSEISSVNTVLLPDIHERNKTIFAVRAVNTQGAKGEICYTGYYYQDRTPPERPSVIEIHSYRDGAKHGHLAFRVDNLVDDESGVESYEYRISKSSTAGLRVQNSRAPAISWIVIHPWTSKQAGLVTNDFFLSELHINAGTRIKIEVRAKNRLQMNSTIGSEIFTIPDLTPPVKPDIEFSSGNLSFKKGGKKRVGLLFKNINDSESGIRKTEYKIYKAPNVNRLVFSQVSGWINIGTSKSVLFDYSKYGLHTGEKIKIKVKTQNNAGLWSVETVKTHTLK